MPHQLDLFCNNVDDYCSIHFDDNDNRNISFSANGFRELAYEARITPAIVAAEQIHKYKYCLIPLMSVKDTERLITSFQYKPKQTKFIVGGFGCISIYPILHLIDYAYFGRCELMATDIFKCSSTSNNCFCKLRDPCLNHNYTIRQPQRLLTNELTVGCANKCMYCQYTFTRKYRSLYGDGYNHGKDLAIPEDSFDLLSVNKSGRYTTALDGFSQITRHNVNKNISDELIYKKIRDMLLLNNSRVINLKIYQIVGYPWESKDSVINDILNFGKLLKCIDDNYKGIGRVLIMFCVTPFSPEPITPMEDVSIKIIDWRDVFNSLHKPRQVYKGDNVEAFILPQIPGPYTLIKRVAINRGIDGNIFRDAVQSIDKSNIKSFDKYKTFVEITGKKWNKGGHYPHQPSRYLSTYCDYKKLKSRFNNFV